jgi:hypothetical protein
MVSMAWEARSEARDAFLFLLDFNHFAALVLAAMRAGPVWQFLLVAVGTLRKSGGFELVVSAAIASTGGGMASFRVRHLCTSES